MFSLLRVLTENSLQYFGKQLLFPCPKKMPQIKIRWFKCISLVGSLVFFASKVWGLFHHWRLWLPEKIKKFAKWFCLPSNHTARCFLWKIVARLFFCIFTNVHSCFLHFSCSFPDTDHLGRCTLPPPGGELTTKSPLCLLWLYETYPVFKDHHVKGALLKVI